MEEAMKVRPYNSETDRAFIFSTWLRNYKHSSYWAKRIKPVVFFEGHHQVVEHLLKKDGVYVYVIGPKDDDDTIWGWIACEPKETERPVVHFIYVKDTFRHMGLAKKMLEHVKIPVEEIIFSHWTYPVDEAMKRWPDMLYNPYRL